MKRYGSLKPPNYKLKNIKAPIYLHYSRNDNMSGEKDVVKLYEQVGSVLGKFLVPDPKFSHFDYLFGIDAPDLVYKRVMSLMNRH